MIIPPYLKKGDTIGITCPAGYMNAEKAQTCISTLQKWGYEVFVGHTLGSQSKTYFSGTDEERLNEFQAMLDEPNIQAILCGRGGYGMGRIIDQLNFSRFKRNPKWIIGFSDITVLHAHLNRRVGVASLHAPMAGAFNDGGFKGKYVLSLKNALIGTVADYSCRKHRFNRKGSAVAELVGGNLALLAHVIGTPSEPIVKNKILFLEDVGEQLYNIDRMMHQLKRSGQLSQLAGLIVGGFTNTQDTECPFGKTAYELIREIVAEYNYPVCFGFPVSHDKENLALKVGGTYKLHITDSKVHLKEIY